MWNLIKKNQSGFTVFELLVSVAIIGMISALFVVNVGKNARENQLDEAVIMLNNQIRELQNLALSSSQYNGNDVVSWSMIMQQGTGLITIFTDNDSVDPGDTVYQAGTEHVKDINLPTEVSFSRFSGWSYKTSSNESNKNWLLVFFSLPDSRAETHIRNNELSTSNPNSHHTSYAEFTLDHVDGDFVTARINDYGLFEVIDN